MNTRIVIKVNFETDGDYDIEGYDYISESAPAVNNSYDCSYDDKRILVHTKSRNLHPYDESFTFMKEFESDSEDHCKLFAKSYLEKLLCNIRFLYTRYFLIPHFYEKFNNAIRSIGKDNYFYECIGGNYEGTDIEIVTIKS